MKNPSYEKSMRDKAASEGKGLMTIAVLYPGKKPGKFGARMAMQGPVNQQEADQIARFMAKIIRERG